MRTWFRHRVIYLWIIDTLSLLIAKVKGFLENFRLFLPGLQTR